MPPRFAIAGAPTTGGVPPFEWPGDESDLKDQQGSGSGSEAQIRSPAELRGDLRRAIQEARAELERLDQVYGRIGHNKPPDEERLAPISQPDRDRTFKLLESQEQQANSAKPNESEVKASTSALKSVASNLWIIAKRKLNKATDKIAENIAIASILAGKDGPALYQWLHDTASSLYHKIMAVIQTAEIWLRSIHLPPL
ncbi:MAG: hypothetical protein JO212_21070 [Acetobacteraceae bacterium]|nr:hypothetical protein [Acetobacteraceae bacterium]